MSKGHDHLKSEIEIKDEPIGAVPYLWVSDEPRLRRFSGLALIMIAFTAFISGVILANVRFSHIRVDLITANEKFNRQQDETRKANAIIEKQNAALATCSNSLIQYRTALDNATIRAQQDTILNPNAAQVLTVLKILKAVL